MQEVPTVRQLPQGSREEMNPEQAQRQRERFLLQHKDNPQLLAFIKSRPAFRPRLTHNKISKRNWDGQFKAWKKRLYADAEAQGIDLVPMFIPEQFDDSDVGRRLVASLVCNACHVRGNVGGACAKCERAVYCGRNCQQSHWNAAHRLECGKT